MSATTEKPAGATAIRPFTIPVTAEADLEALRARVAATRWPDQELVADHSQGPKLAVMQELARYWAAEYDWRRCEAKLNALPHFMTEIDGLDIHFIHVRSEHADALPVIITHGWPGSVIELLAVIDPLTNPAAHGAIRGTHRAGSSVSLLNRHAAPRSNDVSGRRSPKFHPSAGAP
jgi:Epoxide hydrolase N terminus